MINGQRFFQPLDLPSNKNQQRNQTSPSTALIIALNENNNYNTKEDIQRTKSLIVNGKTTNSDFKQQNFDNFVDNIKMPQTHQNNQIIEQNGQKLDEMSEKNFEMPFLNNGQNIPLLQSTNNNFVDRQNFQQYPQQNKQYFSETVKGENKEEEEDDYVLPWARGCPQPKSGQRGSRIWMEGNEMLKRVRIIF